MSNSLTNGKMPPIKKITIPPTPPQHHYLPHTTTSTPLNMTHKLHIHGWLIYPTLQKLRGAKCGNTVSSGVYNPNNNTRISERLQGYQKHLKRITGIPTAGNLTKHLTTLSLNNAALRKWLKGVTYSLKYLLPLQVQLRNPFL